MIETQCSLQVLEGTDLQRGSSETSHALSSKGLCFAGNILLRVYPAFGVSGLPMLLSRRILILEKLQAEEYQYTAVFALLVCYLPLRRSRPRMACMSPPISLLPSICPKRMHCSPSRPIISARRWKGFGGLLLLGRPSEPVLSPASTSAVDDNQRHGRPTSNLAQASKQLPCSCHTGHGKGT